jgi:hypothetical protein
MNWQYALAIITLAAQGVQAQEAVVTLSSRVTGSLEQPRVMYILPWQQPGDADFDLAMGNGLADDVFAPLDRSEFLRELHAREQITNKTAEAEKALSNTAQ